MKENIMSEEAFDELINGFEVVEKLTMYGRKNIKYHVQKLQQENKQLKEKLDKYENPEDMTLFAMWCTEKVKEENKKLNQQVENYEIEGYKQNEELNKMSFDIRKYKNQQKEFIKYMNSCIKELEKESTNKLQNTINLGITDIAKTILQKYKEIIGGTNENNKKRN